MQKLHFAHLLKAVPTKGLRTETVKECEGSGPESNWICLHDVFRIVSASVYDRHELTVSPAKNHGDDSGTGAPSLRRKTGTARTVKREAQGESIWKQSCAMLFSRVTLLEQGGWTK